MILRQMRLKVLVVDVEYFYCTNGSCRMLENSWVGDHDPCMVTQHHRHPETLIDGVPCQNHPSQNMCVLPKLEDLIIKVTGTRSEKEAAHLHNMGFGCKECPLVGQKLDVEGCKRDKNKPSWGSPGWSR